MSEREILASTRACVCIYYRRSSCAMPVTVFRSSARRTRTVRSASRRGRSASTVAIRSAFELECTDEVNQHDSVAPRWGRNIGTDVEDDQTRVSSFLCCIVRPYVRSSNKIRV